MISASIPQLQSTINSVPSILLTHVCYCTSIFLLILFIYCNHMFKYCYIAIDLTARRHNSFLLRKSRSGFDLSCNLTHAS